MPACTTNGASICSGCSAGYYLSGSSCAANTCTCSSGTAAAGTACPTHGASICSGCSAGYHLDSTCSSPSALPGSPTASLYTSMTCNSNECSCYNVTMSDGTFVGVRQQYCLSAGYAAWYAIDPSSSAVHAGIPSAANAHYVSYELPTARSLSGYSIGVRACNSHDNPNHPSTRQMQGSNDYSSWTALDS